MEDGFQESARLHPLPDVRPALAAVQHNLIIYPTIAVPFSSNVLTSTVPQDDHAGCYFMNIGFECLQKSFYAIMRVRQRKLLHLDLI